MKIAITGHTRGIGKALAEHFTTQGYEVIGFSRANGYDITNTEDLSRIVEEASDCDVFINNAYAHTGQTALLVEMISAWHNTTKTIININSKMSLMATAPSSFMKEYISNKQEQSKIIQARMFKARPHLINFITSLVDTEMAATFEAKKTNPADLARFIGTLLEYNSVLAVQEIIVEVTDLDWDDIKQAVIH